MPQHVAQGFVDAIALFGFAAEEREFALAHVKKAEVAAYQRGTSVEKRRPMMQAWANYCEGKQDENILQFPARAA